MGKGFSNAELAAKALERRQKGERPNALERRALEAERKRMLADHANAWLRDMPKTEFAAVVDRHIGQINRQADTWGIPCGGKRVDVEAVVRWFWSFLGENAGRLRSPDTDDALMAAEVNSPALERLRRARATLAELDLAERERKLLPSSVVARAHEQIAHRLRQFGEAVGQRDADLLEQYHRTLEACQQDVTRLLAGKNTSREPPAEETSQPPPQAKPTKRQAAKKKAAKKTTKRGARKRGKKT